MGGNGQSSFVIFDNRDRHTDRQTTRKTDRRPERQPDRQISDNGYLHDIFIITHSIQICIPIDIQKYIITTIRTAYVHAQLRTHICTF